MGIRLGKRPYKSHRSSVGYRGLIHRVLGKRFIIKRKYKFDLRDHKKKQNGGGISMHHHAEVWIPNKEDFEAQVDRVLAPYNEEFSEKGFWGWYMIGGRWKGIHVPGYNPEEDPNHKEPCKLCLGTGTRNDLGTFCKTEKEKVRWLKWSKGCNGCHGSGVQVTWPTEWEPHPKDVISVDEIQEDFNCYTLILPGEVLHSTEFHLEAPEGMQFQKTSFGGKVIRVLKERGIATGYLVTVDYHS